MTLTLTGYCEYADATWLPTSALNIDPRATTYIAVRTTDVTTYRWKPYKPDGARQMKAQGRWQRAEGAGDFVRWSNCPAPDGEWRTQP